MSAVVRQFPTLSWPPSNLEEFPSRLLPAGFRLFRVVRKGKGPWWFGSTLEGRFDLPEPYGTCYLAVDPLAALLEFLGPERTGGIVSADFFAERRVRELQIPEEVTAADVTARSEGVALFGLHGERKAWKRGWERTVSRELIRRLRSECDIEVLPVPHSHQLRIIDVP